MPSDSDLMIPDNPEQDYVINLSGSNLHIPEALQQSGAGVSPRSQRQMYHDIRKELDVARIQALMQNSQGSAGSQDSEVSEQMPLQVYKGIQDRANAEETELRRLLDQFKEATAAQQAQQELSESA